MEAGRTLKRVSLVRSWALEMGTDLIYNYNIGAGTDRNLKLCFVQIPVPGELGLIAGNLSIKIEIADEGQTHLLVFATDAQLDDPARRIAFRIRGKNATGETIEFYPSRKGYQTVAKTNTLADKVIYGLEAMAISKKPRRYLWLDPPNNHWGPALQKLVKGGYTTEE